jgi:hypothetical protein
VSNACDGAAVLDVVDSSSSMVVVAVVDCVQVEAMPNIRLVKKEKRRVPWITSITVALTEPWGLVWDQVVGCWSS